MLKPYFLRYKNTLIGIFIETNEGLKYSPIQDTADKVPNGLGYPLGLFPLDPRESGLIPNSNHAPTPEDITLWLSDRVFPKDRQGAEALRQEIGLAEYDMWGIAKITKGISLSDYYWLSSNPDDRYEDVHPRFVETPSNKIASIKHEKVKAKAVHNSYSELRKSLKESAENISSLSTINWKIELPEEIKNFKITLPNLIPDFPKFEGLEEIKKMLNSPEWQKLIETAKSFEGLIQIPQISLITEISEAEEEKIEGIGKEKGDKDNNKNIDDVWD